MSSAKSHHVHPNSKSFELLRLITPMTSINHSNNLSFVTLHFPTTSASGSGDSYCTSQDAEIKEAKEELKKFKDNSDEKSKKEEELKKLQSGLEEHIAKDHSLDESTRKTKIDEVEKQKNFVNNFKSNFNSALDGNILTNLCSGLETFLGFNSTSKGYDGSGIVYSDLDRLCDAVMGFLYQVLTDVSEKQPYSVGKTMLKDFVETELKPKLSTGREGFEVIETVAEKVREYNERVKESNDSAKTPIKTLLRQVGEDFKTKVSDILNDNAVSGQRTFTPDAVEKAVDSVDMLAKKALGFSFQFDNDLTEAEHKILAISDLNNDCNKNVRNAQKQVKQEGKRLFDFARHEKGNLIVIADIIRTTLEQLKKDINDKATDQIRELVWQLKLLVKGIRDTLNDLCLKLGQYLNKLTQWMKEIEIWIQKAKDEHVDKIVTLETGKAERYAIGAKAEELKDKKIDLDKYVNSVRDDIHQRVVEATAHVKELDHWKREAGDLLSGAKQKCDAILGKVNKDNDPTQTQIYTKSKELRQKAVDLLTAYDTAKRGLGTLVEQAKVHVETLEDVLKGDLYKLKEDIKSEVGKLISSLYDAARAGGDLGQIAGRLDKSKLAEWLRRYKGTGLNGIPSTTTLLQVLSAFAKDPSAGTVNQNNSAYKAMENDIISKMDSALPDEADVSGQSRRPGKIDISRVSSLSNYEQNKLSINNAFMTVGTQTLNNFKQHITKSHYGEITILDDQLDTVKRELENVTKFITDIGGPSSKNDGIRDLVDDLKTYGIYGVRDWKVGKKVTKPLGRIRQDINSVLGDVDNISTNLTVKLTTDALSNFSTSINDNLKKLTQAFSDAGKRINEYFGYIKNTKIRNHLTSIKTQIETLQLSLLNGPVRDATSFIDIDADKISEPIIQNIAAFVSKQVESTNIILLTAARRNYVTSVKQLLTAFADKVSAELQGLPDEIERDLRIGFKGFMKTLEGKPDDQNQQPRSPGGGVLPKPSKLEELRDIAKQKNLTVPRFLYAFRKFHWKLYEYVNAEIRRVHEDNNSKKNPPGQDLDPYAGKMTNIKEAVNKLIEHIADKQYYDHEVDSKLDTLKHALSELKPNNFDKPNTPVIDALTDGLQEFVKELRKVYVSAYDSQQFESELVEILHNPQTAKLTDYGRKCAKVFSTLLEVCNYDLKYMKEECEIRWRDRQICLKSNDDDTNDLGSFLKHCGYGVPSMERVQDNELQCKDSMRGKHVYRLFTNDKSPPTITDEHHIKKCVPKDYNYSVLEFAECLMNHLKEYYQVCHYEISTSTKYPSNINQMLTWLSGLPHSTVYQNLCLNGFGDLFDKKDKEVENSDGGITFEIEGDGIGGSSIAVSTKEDNKLEAYPVTITPTSLSDILAAVCSGAHDVLTSVLGHGHAGGRYACDFNTNPDKFSYPADMVTLACWLYDILKRVHHQLYFLYQQCYHNTERNGWAECWYGRYVAGSSWQCNKMQCPDQTCEQKCKQTCNQIHNQKGDQHPNCGLKSPLQSFLEDGLQGFLPHHVKFERGKLECSVKGHFNLPCKTPMGFGNISDIASHTQRGRHIYEALKRLCGDERSPLPKLCGQLSCLLPSAPKSLDDMFAFYYRLLRGWNNDYPRRKEHRETAFREAVMAANFEDSNTVLDISTICKHNEHTVTLPDKKSTHITGDLYALIDCNGMSSSAPSHPCGRYMRPICHDMCGTFTKENADKYLSWIVYCTETFLQLLKQLYEECNNNCAGERPKCRISKCKKGCKALESPMAPGSAHDDSCKSIVDCKFMRPTFFKYGLVLGDCKDLSSKSTKRTCKDLCMVLKSVTNEEESSKHPLAELVYRTIPNFLYQIRFPFMSLTLALWLLSFLYLLHIMVIRLDLLHIKSHLHSPSSHRIAAQSLLAAARVNKLNRVFYLQP